MSHSLGESETPAKALNPSMPRIVVTGTRPRRVALLPVEPYREAGPGVGFTGSSIGGRGA
jgi:hypothetical protein